MKLSRGTSPGTLVDLLHGRAGEARTGTTFTFLADGEGVGETWSCADLDRRARAIGAMLAGRGLGRQRVLLLYPAGLEFVAGFFGCLYAGAVAVPAYPPRRRRALERLRRICRDADPAAVLTTSALAGRVRSWLAEQPDLASLPWLPTDDVEPAAAEVWQQPSVAAADLAFLQYTSGSTGDPKGVMVRHDNLLANQEAIRRAFRQGPDSVVVGWLPLYHDMGLIGNVLQPLYSGGRCVLMSPAAFLQRPVRWLRAIDRHRATTSGGPDFAYDLCVRKIRPEDAADLDLSSWRVAFNGSEPVRAGTLERFTAAFAGQGFSAAAFQPCYGLAEATLLVSGEVAGERPLVRSFAAADLERERAVSEPPGGGRPLVGCGGPAAGQEVLVVDPETRKPRPPGTVGEVWVAGPGVAAGYWRRGEETREVFGARLCSGEGPYLRTGDLGFLADAQLFVTGRRKDLILLRGRNVYPQDVEATAEAAHDAVRAAGNAAFGIELDGRERLVVVCELEPRSAADPRRVAETVRIEIAEEHEVAVHEVVAVPAGAIPRTSSGKLRRSACRERYLAGRLETLGRSRGAEARGEPEAAAPPVPRPEVLEGRRESRLDAAARFLEDRVAGLLGVDPEREPGTRAGGELGLDSLQAVELRNRIESELGIDLPLAAVLESPDVGSLARRLVDAGAPAAAPAAPSGAGEAAAPTLSYGQRALRFLHQVSPESPALNLPFAVRVRSAIDRSALERALRRLVERHPILRTTFPVVGGEPVARVLPPAAVTVAAASGAGWSEERRRRWLTEEALRPFDLAAEPPLRVSLLEAGRGEDLLVIVGHHVAVDFWSFTVLAEELHRLLPAEAAGRPVELPAAATAADHAAWEHARLQGPEGERLWAYWRERFADAPPPPRLPRDRPRPGGGWDGGVHLAPLDPALTGSLENLARSRKTTLYTVLLAAFQALLHRYGGQSAVVVASPAACRSQPWLEGVVGYLMNPLPLRADVGDDPAFLTHLERCRRTVVDALDHQDFPSHLLAERVPGLREVGGEGPFQVVFVFNRPHARLGPLGLSRIALGIEGAAGSLGGLELEAVAPDRRAALFDLQLTVVAEGGSVTAGWQYARDLFDATTVARMAAHWETLLRGVAGDPGAHLSRLPLSAEAERAQILREWSGAGRAPAPAAPLHRLVARRAEERPDALAVVSGERHLSYGELARRAAALARDLRERGIGPDSVVGIHLERGLDMVTALLGVLHSGAAYLPLDPALPAERLTAMMTDAGARLAVARTPGPEFLAPGAVVAPRPPVAEDRPPGPAAVDADHLACLIFTSGSTGRPRGVAVRHGSIAAYVAAVGDRYGAGVADRVLQFSSLGFDVSAEEIFLALTTGGVLVLRDEEAIRSPAALLESCLRWRISILSLPTSYWHELAAALGAGEAPPWPVGLRLVTIGGERALPERLVAWRRAAPADVRLINGYGPTEVTVAATMTDIAGPRSATAQEPEPPLGRPLPGVRLAVLDPRLEPVPAGVEGELHVAGGGLARGYRGRPGPTAESFVPDPFATSPGERLYRTGDLVRHLRDGGLRFLGRRDDQVKVRGFRVEPGEVENHLHRHPQVAEAAVAAQREGSRSRLVAYVALRTSPGPGIEELRRFLGRSLPEYALPAAFVLLPRLPRLPSGKVDRRTLPRPERSRDGLGSEYVEARGAVEEMVAGVACQVLGLERIGVHDDLFALGCHSLLATQIVARLQEALRVELPVVELFEAPTVAGLAARIESLRGALELPPIRRVRRDREIPLSFSQERLWFLHQLDPASTSYHVPRAIRLRGPLPLDVMAATWDELVRRHEILRTRFPTRDGRPVQEVAPPRPVPLPVVELAAVGTAAAEERLRALLVSEARRTFDLEYGPLLRLLLFRLRPEEHVLLLTEHHLVHDGWTEGVLLRDFQAIYGAFVQRLPSPLPDLPIQYADYARWQREWLTGEVLEAQLTYWRRHLEGAPDLLELPADRPRPPVQSYRGASRQLVLPGPLARSLREPSRGRGTTLFITLLAGFAALLWRITHRDDLVIGTGVANRRRRETEGLLGMVINTLALRTRIPGEPGFDALLERVREVCLGAYAHQDLPFEKVVEALRPARSLAHAPVFQVVFAFHDAPHPELDLPGLELSSVETHNRSTKFDLLLRAMPRAEQRAGLGPRDDGSEIVFGTEYNTDLFDATTVERLWSHYRNLLAAIAADPARRIGDLPLMDVAERAQTLLEWNDQRAAVEPGDSLVRLFAAAAAASPDAVAVVYGDDALSYRELARRSYRLARRLRRRGIGAGSSVGLLYEPSLDMVVGVLGVLASGAAYVPLDPGYPEHRLAFMLRDSGAALVVAPDHLSGACAAAGFATLTADAAGDEAEDPAPPPPHPLEVAYVLYTSGTTGEPKGVVVQHGAVANYAHALRRRVYRDVAPPLRVSLNARVAFDASVKQLSHLAWGHCLVVVPEVVRLDPEAMCAFARARLDVLDGSPSQLKQLLAAGLDARAERPSTVLVGGEAIEETLWARLAGEPSIRFFNHYGPTECTVNTTVCAVSGERPRLGRPIANVRVHPVDPRLRVVPTGVPGELAIGGAGLARGYLGRPRGTAERFVPDAFGGAPGSRLYRSGDLVRLRPGGDVEFLGRIDQQVKVRGFRIELEEIESLLRRQAGVKECVVAVRSGPEGDPRLVAYAVPADPVPEAAELRRALRELLPDYMVPAAVTFLDALPLNANGKVDRRALPDPDRRRGELESGYVAPDSETEVLMARLWSEVLGVERVGVHDDFFDLGGHSLLATRLVSRLRTQFAVELPLVSLFELPTVSQLAQRVEDLRIEAVDPGEIDRILRELDGLSEQEALARLSAAGAAGEDGSDA